MRLKDVFDLKIGRIPEYLIMVRQPPSPIEDISRLMSQETVWEGGNNKNHRSR